MIRKSTILFLMVAVFLLTRQSHAAPLFGKIFDLRQPDGSMIKARVWGDEFYQVVESPDGYTLVRDPISREICYAELSVDGDELVSTGISASGPLTDRTQIKPRNRISKAATRAKARAARHRFAEREIEAISMSGAAPVQPPFNDNTHIRGICLIVDFRDVRQSRVIEPSDVYDFCNKEGYRENGNNGSVRDYFLDVSDGKLDYTNYVPTAYYTANHDKNYYDDCNDSLGIKVLELIVEALDDLDRNGLDFSDYDADKDGRIDAINCFYAGYTSCGWGKGLWPHKSAMPGEFQADGVYAYSYQISDMGDELTLGHMLCGWPDL